MSNMYTVDKALLDSGIIETYYSEEVLNLFEYVIINKKKLQSVKFANVDCIGLVIPSPLRKKFKVIEKIIDIHESYVVKEEN